MHLHVALEQCKARVSACSTITAQATAAAPGRETSQPRAGLAQHEPMMQHSSPVAAADLHSVVGAGAAEPELACVDLTCANGRAAKVAQPDPPALSVMQLLCCAQPALHHHHSPWTPIALFKLAALRARPGPLVRRRPLRQLLLRNPFIAIRLARPPRAAYLPTRTFASCRPLPLLESLSTPSL